VVQRLLRYLTGLLVPLMVDLGLRVVFGPLESHGGVEAVLRFIRYMLTDMAVAWWAPAAFVRLGLASKENDQLKPR
jgi:hypothetical protein